MAQVNDKIIPYDRHVTYDFEWDENYRLWCASFVYDDGTQKVLHLADYKDDLDLVYGSTARQKLIRDIQHEFSPFNAVVSYYGLGDRVDHTKPSDNEVLARNEKELRIPSIMEHGRSGFILFKDKANIDLCKAFEKLIVQSSIFNNKYRNLKLETISQCFFGEGKLGRGADAETWTVEQQKAYCLKDSVLTSRLMRVGELEGDTCKLDGGILKLYGAIADIIEESRVENNVPLHYKMNYDRVVYTNITTWWAQVLRNNKAPDSLSCFKSKKPYEGGAIMDPEVGYYENVEVVDVQSLYPSIVINYNLSHETVCCTHPDCELEAARVPGLEQYWVCMKQRGIFSRVCEKYKTRRVEFKKAGNTVMATGLKIFLNGGYGAYGNPGFAYADMRVAEIVTAYGRWITIQKMKPQAEALGFKVLYADTDSLFLYHKTATNEERKKLVQDLIEWTKKEMDLVLEHEKTFTWVELIGKKHYVGRAMDSKGKSKLMIKGMEGKKGDRCKWVRQAFDKVIEAVDKNKDPTMAYNEAYDALYANKVPHDDLKIWTKLSKDPSAYGSNCTSKQVGELHHAKESDLVWYFKAKKGATLEYALLDKEKYIKQLDAAVKEVIELKGYSLGDEPEGKEVTLESWSQK